MKSALLSIIVTAHNSEKYLEGCLQSLTSSLAGNFDLCEILLINDASSDDSEGIYDRFAATSANIKKFNVSYENIGMVRNFAVQKCSGQYITMLDGDDLLISASLIEILAFLSATRPDILITKLNGEKMNVRQGGALRFAARAIGQHKAIREYLIHKSFQAHFIGKFIKSDILKKHPFPEFVCYEDAFLFLEVLQHCHKIYYSDSGFYLYIKRIDSLSTKSDEGNIKLYQKALERMNAILGDKYPSLQVCHWIEFINRYHNTLALWHDRGGLKQCLQDVKVLPFILNPYVRWSFKRKLFKVKRIIKAW
ncbi:glycosyltransferase family 2 protein [Acerihabitans sp. KWT182]|uniref:Glycosyltransferase family 2 protein n=1 Tax=Acerihabitans sp. KWT182 TaxID=3157919 RepID=A0AAU7Q863_9GAMM